MEQSGKRILNKETKDGKKGVGGGSKHTCTPKTAGNKIRVEINQLETKKTIQRIKETKSWFFEKIQKIDKPLAKLTKDREIL